MENAMVKLTGLYKSMDKNGNLVLSGSINKISRFMVLHNNFKRDEQKDPDFYLYVTENVKEKQEQDQPAEAAGKVDL
jgi:hypothetical protein